MSDKQVENKDVIELGKNIRLCRRRKHMSQEKLGQEAFMSGKAISRIEQANIITGIDKIFAIMDGLDVTPLDIFPQRYVNQISSDHAKDTLLLVYLWKALDYETKNLILKIMRSFLENKKHY